MAMPSAATEPTDNLGDRSHMPLRNMTSPEAVTAVERLRGQIEVRWRIYLG